LFLNFSYLCLLRIQLNLSAVCSVLRRVFHILDHSELLNFMLRDPLRALRGHGSAVRPWFDFIFLLLLSWVELCLMDLLLLFSTLPRVFLGHSLVSLFLPGPSDGLFGVVDVVLDLLCVFFVSLFLVYVAQV